MGLEKKRDWTIILQKMVDWKSSEKIKKRKEDREEN